MNKEQISIIYDGINLSELFDGVISIDRGSGPGWSNTLIGKDFVSSETNPKKIVVDFFVYGTKNSFVDIRRKLSAALSKRSPSNLSFSDEPNLIYQAIVDGEVSFDEKFTVANGRITFLVPSGTAESTATNTLNKTNSGGINGTITTNANKSLKVTIKNQGTVESYPVIRIKNIAENGYIGLVGANGLMEIGKREEADGAVFKESQVLYNGISEDVTLSKFINTDAKNPQSLLNATGGTLEYQSDGLRFKNQGTFDSTHVAAGGMKFMALPADSNGHVGAVNFYSYFNIFAWAGAFGQTGLLQVLFTDANNKLVAGYGVSKSDTVGNTGSFKCWVGGNNPREHKSINFTTNNGEDKNNPISNGMFNSRTGNADFVKTKDKLEFYWYGSRIPVNVPELANVEIAKIFIYIGQFVKSNSFMTNLALRQLLARKDEVGVWKDLPNRYAKGSTIEIDMSNGRVTRDGIAVNNDLITGSKFFSLPPGQSQLEVYSSSWVKAAPEVEIIWKERYL